MPNNNDINTTRDLKLGALGGGEGGGEVGELVRVAHIHPRREVLRLLPEERVHPHKIPDHAHHLDTHTHTSL